jgi:hypothetical protein
MYWDFGTPRERHSRERPVGFARRRRVGIIFELRMPIDGTAMAPPPSEGERRPGKSLGPAFRPQTPRDQITEYYQS